MRSSHFSRALLGIYSIWAFFFITAAGAIAVGQTQPSLENGFKDYGSIHGSNIDSVNLMNGNWMLHAGATPDVPQRGDLDFQYFLTATSKTWQIVCTPNTTNPSGIVCYWRPGTTGANMDYSGDLRVHRTVDINNSGNGSVSYDAYGYSILTPDGATHQLYPVPGTADATGEATKFVSIDTTGLQMTMSGADGNGVNDTATITDRHGSQYLAHFAGYASCPKATQETPPSPLLRPGEPRSLERKPA